MKKSQNIRRYMLVDVRKQFEIELVRMIEMVIPELIPEPEDEVKDGETFVGILDDELKAIYAVYAASRDDLDCQCERDHGRIAAIIRKRMSQDIEPDELAFVQQHSIAHDRHKFISDFFWDKVEKSFPELTGNKDSIGLRRKWKVVTTRKPPQIDVELVFEMFRAITSGGFGHM
ncbi:MAG: hypothetical protein NTY81_00115 [Candidatus Staskawiczbacteria bacterium]|nr:hypothetical protein [Candidatus Staskawiczbacteria bacterium]